MDIETFNDDLIVRIKEVVELLGGPKPASDKSGVSRGSIYKYMSGENEPSLKAILKLALAADISFVWLASGLGDIDEPNMMTEVPDYHDQPSAKAVAQCLLHIQDKDDQITNMKLQKLLYYVQLNSIAATKEPMFWEKIKAWQHGPVIPQVYHEYKKYDKDPIPRMEEPDRDTLSDEQRRIITKTYKLFGQYSMWKLRHMTHKAEPWRLAKANEEEDNEITIDMLRAEVEKEGLFEENGDSSLDTDNS